MSRPTITVVVPVYNAEAFVEESLTAVLSQTRPPDEVVVVDDGSTDGTRDALAPFGAAIRVVSQENRGHPGAYDRGFTEATGDYVARCDADDIWEPVKLERQHAAVVARPEVDIAFGGAWVFGRTERRFAPAPADGVLDTAAFARLMYRGNVLCSSTALVRRSLYARIGPFVDRLSCEDYDFWLKALKAGAVFYSDPEILVRYRHHDGNHTNNLIRMHEATNMVHNWHADLVDDPRLVRAVLAQDLTTIGRLLADQGSDAEARRAFVRALRLRPTPFAAAWIALLSAPRSVRPKLVGSSVSLKRRLEALAR
jgi:glycosyltransferase involved in cell wall biosynthesis